MFGMYVLFKMVTLNYAMTAEAEWFDVIRESWTDNDFAMLMMILTFWFVGRPIERRIQNL